MPILRLTTPKLHPKEQRSLFGDPGTEERLGPFSLRMTGHFMLCAVDMILEFGDEILQQNSISAEQHHGSLLEHAHPSVGRKHSHPVPACIQERS
jgi:hypothetical protein